VNSTMTRGASCDPREPSPLSLACRSVASLPLELVSQALGRPLQQLPDFPQLLQDFICLHDALSGILGILCGTCGYDREQQQTARARRDRLAE